MRSLVRLAAFVALLYIPDPLLAEPFRPGLFSSAEQVANDAIADASLIGGVLHVERRSEVYERAFGSRAVDPAREAASQDTIYDVASLTKPLATAPSIVLLAQRGALRIDDPVHCYLPEFNGSLRDAITLRHLLTHTSALPAGLSLQQMWSGPDEAIRRAAKLSPTNRPGFIFRYSDVNFILLAEIVHRVSGTPLDVFARREIFLPLEMRDTMFAPPSDLQGRIAPTERSDGVMLRGVVHDPTSRRMRGVAGHAGLFTTAADVALFLRNLLATEPRIFTRQSALLLTSRQSPQQVTIGRTLGFDIDSNYSRPRGRAFSPQSFGHTGWTGSFFWVEPAAGEFYIFLSNRVHPRGRGSVVRLQNALGTAVASALGHSARTSGVTDRQISAGGVDVANGIDVLAASRFSALSGRRVALVTNHTGRDRDGNPTIDLLRSAPDVDLRVLFSPEHGIRGEVDDTVEDSVDTRSGLPIYSLYDKTISPTSAELMNIDTIVFDVQDIGVRYYTYAFVLFNIMKAAAENGIELILLDRVNPLNGVDVGGPATIEKVIPSAFHAIAIRHGMTLGELATMFAAERDVKVRLTVVPLRGWNRESWLDATSQAWIPTSPNLRNLTAAALYPAVGMIETASVSVGRGTDLPLEIVGAPYISGAELVSALAASRPPGVRFEPIVFTPRTREFKGERCEGVRIVLRDRAALRPLELGVLLASTLHRLYGDRFNVEKMNLLLQHGKTIDAIRSGKDIDEIVALWKKSIDEFKRRRATYLLY